MVHSPICLVRDQNINDNSGSPTPIPDWLITAPSEQAKLDATRLVFSIQRDCGIDLPADGELYRFDLDHPDSNGMIDYFVKSMSGTSMSIGRKAWMDFAGNQSLQYRKKTGCGGHRTLWGRGV